MCHVCEAKDLKHIQSYAPTKPDNCLKSKDSEIQLWQALPLQESNLGLMRVKRNH